MNWPTESEYLFVFAYSRENACLDPWGRSYSSDARNFRLAAESLVERACDETRLMDPLVYPIVESYRHSLELWLKDLIGKAQELEGERINVPAIHDLGKLWSKAETLLRAHYSAEAPGALDHVGPSIRQFIEHDPRSTSFRYPRGLDGGLVLEEITSINLRHLSGVMERLGDLLECLSIDLGERVDWSREMNAQFGV